MKSKLTDMSQTQILAAHRFGLVTRSQVITELCSNRGHEEWKVICLLRVNQVLANEETEQKRKTDGIY